MATKTVDPYRLPSISTELIQVPIAAVDDDGEPVDLSALPVFLAFMPSGEKPTVDDLHVAEWTGDGAQLLVGPENGGIVYPAGRYKAWWKVTSDPEVPIRPADSGGLVVY